jgi:hypothetical protein
VADRLFDGEEAVLHVMGRQIASEKRRNPWIPREWLVARGESWEIVAAKRLCSPKRN